MDRPENIRTNLETLRARIGDAARSAGRDPSDVTLVAISKYQPAEAVRAALEAGHRDFGENRIQEAEEKWPALLTEFPDTTLHFVGPLQTNKVAAAVALCHVIHAVDREKLARKLAEEMREQNVERPCFIQVNTGEEPQKAGVHPDQADDFIAYCRDALGLPVAGLMCIPPLDENAGVHFAYLGEIAKRHGLRQLSMGMSADFEVAVKLGATHVRLGTAVFGERPSG